MPQHTYQQPVGKAYGPLGVVVGIAFSIGLFVAMAVAQMMSAPKPPKDDFEGDVFAIAPPDIEPIQEEPPPPPPPEEEPPELEPEPPQISLDMMEMALDVGSGGSGGFDIALPGMDTASTGSLALDDFFRLEDLDKEPRFQPGGDARVIFQNQLKASSVLRRKFLSPRAEWSIIVTYKVDRNGRFVGFHEVDSTDPALTRLLEAAFKQSQPEVGTKDGQPVPYLMRTPLVKRRS